MNKKKICIGRLRSRILEESRREGGRTKVNLLGPGVPVLGVQVPVGLSQRVWVHGPVPSTTALLVLVLVFPN